MSQHTTNNLKLKEPVNVLGCHYIVSLDDNELVDLIYDEAYSYTEALKYAKSIKRFCSTCLKSAVEGESVVNVTQTYRFAKDKKDGRMYVSMGLQNICRPVRSLLCRDTSWDYDMVNAHPTLALYIANKELGLQTPTLKCYVENREEFLDENEIDKHHIIKLLNTDKGIALYTTTALKTLGDELSTIREIVYAKYKDAVPCDKRYNKKSSVLNHVICTHEDGLIKRIMSKFPLKHFHALCFDGFLYDKDDSEHASGNADGMEVSELNRFTKDYGIQWAQKDMGEDIVIPEDFTPPTTYTGIKKIFEQTHAMCLNPMTFIKQGPYGDVLYNKANFQDVAATYEDDEFTLKKWIKDKNRRSYEKMDFIPYTEKDDSPDDIYNTFKPIAAKYIKNKEDRHDDRPEPAGKTQGIRG